MRTPRFGSNRAQAAAGTAAVLAAAVLALGAGRTNPDARASAARFARVRALVAEYYVDRVGEDSLLAGAARGLVRELGDPYSVLYSPTELAAFTRQTSGHYGGLGLLLEAQEGRTVVARVYPDTPAEHAGVLEGDHVEAVGARATLGWALAQVTDSLRGPVGSSVRVRFARAGAPPVERTMVRADVRVPAVPFAARLTPGVGYVPLQQFSDLAGRDVRQAVRALVGAGVRGVVLDLRGNPGGYVEQAVDVAGQFLPPGTDVVQVRERGGEVDTVRSAAPPSLSRAVPLVVLVDAGTASASEIVAGALQDHDRALVLGERSFGKGLVQSVYPLDGGYALKLTTARWHTPLGRALHRARPAGGADTPAAPAAPDAAPNGRPAGASGDGLADSADVRVGRPPDRRVPRPFVRTAGGRLLAADGGVTPDVAVAASGALDGPAGDLLGRAAGARPEVLARVTGELTDAYAAAATPDGLVRPAWRAEFVRRLRAGGIALTAGAADSVGPILDRILAARLLRRAYGDSAVARRFYQEDPVLREAVARLERARTTAALFHAAPRAAPGS